MSHADLSQLTCVSPVLWKTIMATYSNEERIEGLIWYLSVANHSFSKLVTFSPPANGDEMRLQYGLFFQHKIAALDEGTRILKKVDPAFLHRFKATFSEHEYVRKLRDFVVHQGAAIAGRGVVKDQIVTPLCPVVTDRRGTFRSTSPTLLQLATGYEGAVNDAIWAAAESHPSLFDPPFLSKDEMTRLVAEEEHIPPEVLAGLPRLLAQIDPLLVHEDLKASRRDKLARLLKHSW